MVHRSSNASLNTSTVDSTNLYPTDDDKNLNNETKAATVNLPTFFDGIELKRNVNNDDKEAEEEDEADDDDEDDDDDEENDEENSRLSNSANCMNDDETSTNVSVIQNNNEEDSDCVSSSNNLVPSVEKFNWIEDDEDGEVLERKGIYCSVPLDRLSGILGTLKLLSNSPEKISPQKINKFLCLYCDRTFSSQNLRSKHSERIHQVTKGRRSSARNSGVFTATSIFSGCSFCSSGKFTSLLSEDLTALYIHLIDYHSDKYFGCKICLIRFPLADNLIQHKIDEHDFEAETSSPLSIEVNFDESKNKNDESDDEEKSNKPTLRSTSSSRNKQHLLKNEDFLLSRLGLIQNRSPRTRKGAKNRRSDETLNTKVTRSRNGRTSTVPINNVENLEFSANKILSNKNELLSSTFDDDFYEIVNKNVRKNLTCHVDGKLESGPASPSPLSPVHIEPNVRSTVVRSPLIRDTEIHEATSLPAITAFPTLLTVDQYGTEPCASKIKKTFTKNSWKWKWDFIKKYKYVNEGGKIVKKIKQQTSGFRDLSKLDMWTQLTMRNKHEDEKRKIESGGVGEVVREEKRKLVDQLNSILDKRLLPEINLEQNDQRIIKTEPIGDDDENGTLPCQQKLQSNETLNENSFIAELNLKRVNREIDLNRPKVVLSGEWARPRCYVCFGCGARFETLKTIEEHKSFRHPHVYSTHYEIVGRELIERELYKHFYIPSKALQYKTQIAAEKNDFKSICLEDSMDSVASLSPSCSTTTTTTKSEISDTKTVTASLSSHSFTPPLAIKCTKCKKECSGTLDLYRHMLDCAGDYAWLLAKKRLNLKYRYFGNRSKRRKGSRSNLGRVYNRPVRRKVEDSDGLRIKDPQLPRPKPSDAESIQRMLANLPPKRACRQIIPTQKKKVRKIIATTAIINSRNTKNSRKHQQNDSRRRTRNSLIISSSRQTKSKKIIRKQIILPEKAPVEIIEVSKKENKDPAPIVILAAAKKSPKVVKKNLLKSVHQKTTKVVKKIKKSFRKSQQKRIRVLRSSISEAVEETPEIVQEPVLSVAKEKVKLKDKKLLRNLSFRSSKKYKLNKISEKSELSEPELLRVDEIQPETQISEISTSSESELKKKKKGRPFKNILNKLQGKIKEDKIEVEEKPEIVIKLPEILPEILIQTEPEIPEIIPCANNISDEIKPPENPPECSSKILLEVPNPPVIVATIKTPPSKRRAKKLNDCIAMLAGKLQQKLGIPFLDTTAVNSSLIISKPTESISSDDPLDLSMGNCNSKLEIPPVELTEENSIKEIEKVEIIPTITEEIILDPPKVTKKKVNKVKFDDSTTQVIDDFKDSPDLLSLPNKRGRKKKEVASTISLDLKTSEEIEEINEIKEIGEKSPAKRGRKKKTNEGSDLEVSNASGEDVSMKIENRGKKQKEIKGILKETESSVSISEIFENIVETRKEDLNILDKTPADIPDLDVTEEKKTEVELVPYISENPEIQTPEKKRGRKKKPTTEVTDLLIQDLETVLTSDVPAISIPAEFLKKKRGRKKKPNVIANELLETSNLEVIPTLVSETEIIPSEVSLQEEVEVSNSETATKLNLLEPSISESSEATPQKKKRGRKKKEAAGLDISPVEESSNVEVENSISDFNVIKIPPVKKRGRKKKEVKESEEILETCTSEIFTTSIEEASEPMYNLEIEPEIHETQSEDLTEAELDLLLDTSNSELNLVSNVIKTPQTKKRGRKKKEAAVVEADVSNCTIVPIPMTDISICQEKEELEGSEIIQTPTKRGRKKKEAVVEAFDLYNAEVINEEKNQTEVSISEIIEIPSKRGRKKENGEEAVNESEIISTLLDDMAEREEKTEELELTEIIPISTLEDSPEITFTEKKHTNKKKKKKSEDLQEKKRGSRKKKNLTEVPNSPNTSLEEILPVVAEEEVIKIEKRGRKKKVQAAPETPELYKVFEPTEKDIFEFSDETEILIDLKTNKECESERQEELTIEDSIKKSISEDDLPLVRIQRIDEIFFSKELPETSSSDGSSKSKHHKNKHKTKRSHKKCISDSEISLISLENLRISEENPELNSEQEIFESSSKIGKQRKKRKNELASIIADQLLESFKEVDKSSIDKLKNLHDLSVSEEKPESPKRKAEHLEFTLMDSPEIIPKRRLTRSLTVCLDPSEILQPRVEVSFDNLAKSVEEIKKPKKPVRKMGTSRIIPEKLPEDVPVSEKDILNEGFLDLEDDGLNPKRKLQEIVEEIKEAKDHSESDDDLCLAQIAKTLNTKLDEFTNSNDVPEISSIIANLEEALADETNTELVDMDLEDDVSVFTSLSLESSFTTSTSPNKAKKRRGRKSINLLRKKTKPEGNDNEEEFLCEICNKIFRKMDLLVKHRRTITHIAKLSEQEFLQSKETIREISEIIQEPIKSPEKIPTAPTTPRNTIIENMSSPEQIETLTLSHEQRLFFECCNMLKGSDQKFNSNKPLTPKSPYLPEMSHNNVYSVKSPMSRSRSSPRPAFPKIDNQFSDISSDSNQAYKHPTIPLMSDANEPEKERPIASAYPENSMIIGTYSDVFSDMGDSFPSSQDVSESENYVQTIMERSTKMEGGEISNFGIDRSPIYSNSSQSSSASKMLTKGALKGFGNFKVSIPTNGIDLELALVKTSHIGSKLAALADIALGNDLIENEKVVEIPTEIEENEEKEEIQEKEVKELKNTKKKGFGNRLGFKAKKKTKINKKLKKSSLKKSNNPLDIYDFEDSQDSADQPIVPLSKIPGFRANKPIQEEDEEEEESELEEPKKSTELMLPPPPMIQEDSQMSSTSFSDRDEFNYGAASCLSDSDTSSSMSSKKKLKKLPDTNNLQKKCLIMGRIFKNAKKIEPIDEKIDEKETILKKQIPKKELDKLFDSLKVVEDNNLEENENESEIIENRNDLRRSKKSRDIQIMEAEWGMSLEQIKEIIGVGQRKSQRKCAAGKQKILAETWSSDEYEDFHNTKDIIALIQETELKAVQRRNRNNSKNSRKENDTTDEIVEETEVIQETEEINEIKEPAIVNPEPKRSKIKQRRTTICKTKTKKDDSESDFEDHWNKTGKRSKIKKRRKTIAFRESEIVKAEVKPDDKKVNVSDSEKKPKIKERKKDENNRRKRIASEQLYYWSESSDEEFGRIKPDRDDYDDDEVSQEHENYQQHGWIVGDSHKKLVTLLAHAKGKKIEDCGVKEAGNKKKS